ncbi:MAG: hypothetical protein ABW252_12375 [Polyangiales bacterium]
MKRELTFARRGVLVRAIALCAATSVVACADAEDAMQSDVLAQSGAVSLDGGSVATGDAGDAGASATPKLTKASVTEGLASPESAYFDAESQAWYVSNPAAATPGDGFIAKLDATGKLVTRDFIKGLNDPKGVRVHAGTLYATDGTKLVRVKLSAPGEVKVIDVPGARFLNDATVDPDTGIAYFSDLLGNAIYKLDGDTVSELVRAPALEAPNGLIVRDGTLYVAGFGAGAASPGRIQKLDLKSPAAANLKPASDRIGQLDGLEPLGDGWLVSNYSVGTFYVDAGGKATKLTDNKVDGLTAAADLGVSKDLVAVPDGRGSKVVFYTLTR